MLFTGTTRINLDPFDEFSDAEVWAALDAAALGPTVRELEGGLSSVVAEGGSNWSAGEKQLLCMARALLRKARVLVLDEATAAIDPATDQAIQAAVRKLCSDEACTLLAIAHRLDTIIDLDRIMVMDGGELAEFDTPQRLMRIPGGTFAALAADAGVQLPQQQ